VGVRITGSRRHTIAAFLIGLGVCALDVISKILAVADLSKHRSVVLLGGLITLHLFRNPGAAFGIGPSYTATYALIAAGVLALIIRVSSRLQSWPWAIAFGLLIGGASGNLADRIFRSPGPLRGFVIDWIKLPYFPPTFNIADSAITAGAVLLILASIRGWRLDGSHLRSVKFDRPAQGRDVAPPVKPTM
jgi:signal peptidase II